jgi:hypothetical protein
MFSPKYLQLCHADKANWANRQPCLGDWYIDWERKIVDVISLNTLNQVDLRSARYTYLPGADDLLELMDNPIRAWGDDPERKELRITYDPRKK